ncbi:translation elongation factor Ts [bacterium]|nr:translation elongation factor Ts [bacterium]
MSKVSAQLVKELREKTGAGIKDCQEALAQNALQVDKAADWLRQKGISRAEKKADRVTAEGAVGSYIHLGGKVGVLIEVNCETDFVAKTDDFKSLVNELALQVAAMKPDYVSREEVPQETLAAELDGYKKVAMEEGKPENIAEKIAQGKIDKYFSNICLLEMDYIRDDSKKVLDVIKESIAKLGENIRVKRFVRYVLGA